MRLPDSWKRFPVTAGLAVVITAAWVFVALSGLEYQALELGAFVPAAVNAGSLWAWLTPLSCTLLHLDLLHLGMNVLILVFCGRMVESALGSGSMALLYLLGAYAAAAAQYALGPSSEVAMIGASGAISAILGAYAVLFGRNKVKIANQRLAIWLNALWLLAAWVILNLIITYGISISFEGIHIAAAAHIGGFLPGVLLANRLLLFRYRRA